MVTPVQSHRFHLINDLGLADFYPTAHWPSVKCLLQIADDASLPDPSPGRLRD